MGYRIPITLGNIEPLASKPFRPGKMALVCEGGGQRGIFTAGVLDEFQRAGFNPFDLLIGTSAGAQNLSAYICGQMGYARRVITRYTTSAQFFNPLRFVRGGHLIDLDWLVDTAAAQMPLAMDVAEQHFTDGREFLLCACRSDDFEPTYLPAQRERWLPAIKASSAIPGFYRQGVELDGVSYQDGGISDAIPVEEAYRRGADTIVVIRTVPSQMYYTPQWMKRMEHWLSDSSLQQMVRILQHHEQSYHRIQRFIEKPPGKLRIFEIFPPKPLASNALGSRLGALNQDYHLGRRCGRYFLATVGQWMAQQEPDGMKVRKALSRRLIQPENVRMPSPIVTDIAMPTERAAQPEAAVAAPKIILPGDLPPGERGRAVSYAFTDTHCHFDFPPFTGHEAESLARAASAGVKRIIVPTVTADRFARVLRLAQEHAPLFAALGLHPLYIAQHHEPQLEQLAALLAERPHKLVAVGEIGLDLYMDNPQFERQQSVLLTQLKLAKQHDLPVILHSRRTHDQLAAALRRMQLPRRGVVHGFAGSLSQAQAFIRLGYYIGVGGTITYERAQKTRAVMAQLPLEALLLETDAPDMPLAGYQGQPNRPERAAEVFHALCELRPEPADEIAAHLQRNTQALFAMPD